MLTNRHSIIIRHSVAALARVMYDYRMTIGQVPQLLAALRGTEFRWVDPLLQVNVAYEQSLIWREKERVRIDPGQPTTACWDCGKDMMVQDSFSPRSQFAKPFEQRPAYCELCMDKKVKSGRARIAT